MFVQRNMFRSESRICLLQEKVSVFFFFSFICHERLDSKKSVSREDIILPHSVALMEGVRERLLMMWHSTQINFICIAPFFLNVLSPSNFSQNKSIITNPLSNTPPPDPKSSFPTLSNPRATIARTNQKEMLLAICPRVGTIL